MDRSAREIDEMTSPKLSRVEKTFPFDGLAVSVKRSMALRPGLTVGLPLSRKM